MGLSLFHFDFGVHFCPGWWTSKCWLHRCDLPSNFIAPLSFMSPTPLDEAFLSHHQKGSLLSPGSQQVPYRHSYFDCRSELKNFRNKLLWDKYIFITYFFNVFQLHNPSMRRNIPENNLFFFPPIEKKHFKYQCLYSSDFIGAKMNVFFSIHIRVFNLKCTQMCI